MSKSKLSNKIYRMPQGALQFLGVTFIFMLMSLWIPPQASAQLVPSTSATATNQPATPSLPDPLTPESVRQLVSTLSDSQVRELLLERLDAVAKEKAEGAGSDQSGMAVMINAFADVGKSLSAAVVSLPNVGSGVAKAFRTFIGDRGVVGLLKFLAIVVISIGLGFIANWIVDLLTRPLRERIQSLNPEGLWDSLRALLIRFGLDLIKVVAFAAVSLLATRYLHSNDGDSLFAGRFITTIFILILLFAAIGRVVFAPSRADLRLMPIDDESAKRFQSQMILLAIFGGIGPFLVQSLVQYGIPFGSLRLGFWTTSILHIAVIVMIYLSRSGVRQAIRGNDGLMGSTGLKIAHAWPWIAMVLVVLNWLLIQIIAGAERFDLLQGQQHVLLLLIVFIPLLDTAVRGLVRHLTPAMHGEGEVAEQAHLATHRAYLRMGRILLLGIVLMLVSAMFGIDYSNTESTNASERFIARLIDGTLYFFLGYFIWEAVGVWINQKLAKEQTAAGIDMNSDEPGGGEGGGTGISRLATVLPVIRLVFLTAIVVMTILLGLSRLGVDTTPLLAGAGILGLAIGFGAQTLVRDVVSGIFFLIDDAFRVGEYLVIDDTVGTVEKISIRSLQLRHHKGAVHTIPYGEIPKVTNNSRDWTITKLKFTFPFDTDPNQIKKIFKKIGAEMLEADYADDIIQTFKSQGVYDVDDVGIVIRGKFMTKPGTQWVIRKDIYSRVNKALDEAGIQFARREVRVQIPGMEGGKEISEEQANAIGAAASNAVPDPKPAS